MEKLTVNDVVEKLGSLTVMELIALTRQLEEQWGVKAEPQVQAVEQTTQTETQSAQTEFTVVLVSVPADKKMAVVKLVRELTGLGLMESKTLVESAPKNVKESVSKEDAEDLKGKLTAAGAVIEVK